MIAATLSIVVWFVLPHGSPAGGGASRIRSGSSTAEHRYIPPRRWVPIPTARCGILDPGGTLGGSPRSSSRLERVP